MAFSFIGAAYNGNDGTGTTLDTSSSLNVAAGDLLVACVGWEDGTSTIAVAKNSGSPTNDFTFEAGTQWNWNSQLYAAMGWVLAAAADSTATFRATWGTSRPVRQFSVLQFRPTASATVTKDASSTGTGSGTAASSGNITTTGTDEAVVAWAKIYNSYTLSSPLINAISPDGDYDITGTAEAHNYYRIVSSTFTGDADATWASADGWTVGIVAFKAEVTGVNAVVSTGSAAVLVPAIGTGIAGVVAAATGSVPEHAALEATGVAGSITPTVTL